MCSATFAIASSAAIGVRAPKASSSLQSSGTGATVSGHGSGVPAYASKWAGGAAGGWVACAPSQAPPPS